MRRDCDCTCAKAIRLPFTNIASDDPPVDDVGPIGPADRAVIVRSGPIGVGRVALARVAPARVALARVALIYPTAQAGSVLPAPATLTRIPFVSRDTVYGCGASSVTTTRTTPGLFCA